MPVPGGTTRKFSKRALAPFQEIVALAVARVFERDVIGQSFRRAEFIDDDRVIDDEIDRHQRIDLRRIAAELGHAVAHRGEIDDGRNAGEILHQHASRPEADFLFSLALVVEPFGHRRDIGLGDRTPVLVAQKVFEQNLHRVGELRDAGEAVGLGIGQRIVNVALAVDVKGLAAVEAVVRDGFLGAQGQASEKCRRRAAPPECRRIEDVPRHR